MPEVSKNKLKIAWVCHFSTPEIRSLLKVKHPVPQFAPWISNTIKVFESEPALELHIIAPYEYLRGRRTLTLRGVHYHFYNAGIPLWGRHWPAVFRWDVMSRYEKVKRTVFRIMRSIEPDIIHLQGAENPYYSASIIQFLDRYPVVVNLQRMDLNSFYGNSKPGKVREAIEKEILSRFKHFSIRTQTMERDLLTFNPSAKTYWVRYNIPLLKPLDLKKSYDIVYFGRISLLKGIEDLLSAARLVAKTISGLRICIIGSVSEYYRNELENRITGCKINMEWKGQIPTLEEVHQEVSKAKIAVLPSHYDIIPGTIIESMMLGIPVVSYSVGSIPELNHEEESVLLVDKGDIPGLADHMLRLLNNEAYREEIAGRAIQTVRNRIIGTDILEQHLQCYQQVIKHFHDMKTGINFSGEVTK